MLHEAPCPLMTLSNHHGSSTGSPNSTRASSISYELSEDLRAKEIEFMERCYGGRIKAHRAARIIQTAYRNYRINKDYCRLRNEQRMSRRMDSIYCDSTPKQDRITPIEHEKQPISRNINSYDDIVIDKAYNDWDEEIKKLNINRDSLESQNDTPNSSISSSNLGESIKSKDLDHSDVVTSPGKSSGFVSNNSPDTTGSFSLNDSFENADCKNIQSADYEFNFSPIHGNTSNLAYACKGQTDNYQRQKRILYSPQRITAIPVNTCSPHFQFSPTNQNHGLVYISPTKSGQFVTIPSHSSHHQYPIHNKPINFIDGNNIVLSKAQSENQNRKRKRLYRIGLNIFNKSPVKGIEFLTKSNFIESSPNAIAKFLLTRRGLSRTAIGDYLGNSQDKMAATVTRYFIGSIDFRGKELDQALRIMLSYFRTPGESQKIQHLLTEFQTAYIQQNPELFRARFRTEDMVMVISYAIVMLHTDMYNTKIRQQDRMTKEQFIKNLRGCDGGEDVNNEFLSGVFDRIQAEEMKVQSDHTDLVRRIESNLTGPLRPRTLAVPQRRLVCYCSLFEVMDKNKREKLGSHERDVFLFNDLLIITKRIQKKRKDYCIYSVKWCVDLMGLQVISFENPNYPNGIELINRGYISAAAANSSTSITSNISASSSSSTANNNSAVNICLNTKTPADKASFLSDLRECILEVTEMDRIRISDGINKMNLPQRSVSQTSQHNVLPAKYSYQMPAGDVIICNNNRVPSGNLMPTGNYILIPATSSNSLLSNQFQRHTVSQGRGLRRFSGQNVSEASLKHLS